MGPPLRALLAAQLPQDTPFTFYHYSTPPSKSPALFAAPPHAASERTYCESHTLAASITVDTTNTANGIENTPSELLVLAIEVLVYSTARLTTIFVSKADSTGCLADLRLARSHSASPLQAICGTFVSWLARERQRPGKKLVVSLFARAQDQYLFPGSIDNKNKHVLDDRGLVKWWCRVLDPLVWEYKADDDKTPFHDRLLDGHGGASATATATATETTAKGYLVIPGYESYDTLRYVPPSPVPNAPRRWAATHPLLHIAPHPAAPPRCLVPRFPDDPKARFLDELDEELPGHGADTVVADGGTPSRSDGKWKSVKTLDQFWEFMAFRQECSSGRIVGFIWVVLTPPKPSIPEEDEMASSQQSLSQASQMDSQDSVSTPRKKKSALKKRRRKAKTERGPIPLILPRIKTSSSNLSSTSNASSGSASKMAPETSRYFIWPASSRGTICLSSKDYNRAHEILLHLSFSNSAAVARSTKKFREEIAVLGGVKSWGWTVVGTKGATAAPATSASNGSAAATIVGVRKKRKADADGDAVAESAALTTAAPPVVAVNTLGVRRKPKN
jgi:regulator of Ty1 transposition protein 109